MKNNFQKKAILVLKSIGVIFLLTGCNLISNQSTVDLPVLQENDVVDQNIVNATGNVLPEKEAILRFKNNAYGIRILVQQGQFVQKGQILVESNTYKQALAVEEAKAQLASAQSFYDSLLREEFRDVRQAEKDAALKNIEASQAALDAAEDNLAATTLRTPFEGTIIEIYLNSFENVFAGEPVILIADLNSLQIKTNDLDEKEAGKVLIGDPVDISYDAFSNLNVRGYVVDIAQKSSEGPGNYFTVTISPSEQLADLLWGMSAYVEIYTGSAESRIDQEGESKQSQLAKADGEFQINEPKIKRDCENINFLSETVPDGTVYNPGQEFIKTWTFRNIGTCTWNTRYKLVYVSGDQMGGPNFITLPTYVAPDSLLTLEITLIAPNEEGNFRGEWQLQNELGGKILDVWVDIVVADQS